LRTRASTNSFLIPGDPPESMPLYLEAGGRLHRDRRVQLSRAGLALIFSINLLSLSASSRRAHPRFNVHIRPD